MRILLIEDSKNLSEALKEVLEREKYTVDTTFDGESGLEAALSGIYDIIILDVMMPKKNGFEVIKEIREKHINTPVIMLTALSQESDKILGLDSGADDYLSKPFSVPELLARIRALTRRRAEMIANDELTFMGVTLNLNNFRLSANGKTVKLSQKEHELMRFFLEKPNFVAQKEALILKVWGFEGEFESNNLEVFISFLRKKLTFLEAPFTLTSVRGVGYQLIPKEK